VIQPCQNSMTTCLVFLAADQSSSLESIMSTKTGLLRHAARFLVQYLTSLCLVHCSLHSCNILLKVPLTRPASNQNAGNFYLWV